MSLLRLYDSTETVHIDFDWIYDEIKNLKDVPREFDEDFLREVEISDTVLNYWKEIGFSPGYFQRFMLFNWRAEGYTYKEHRAKCLEMLPYIRKENEKIGQAIADYYEAEDKALEWFCTPRDGYIYELSDWYDDESGGDLHMSTSWEEVYEYMKMDSEEGGDNSYFICRYSLKNEDGVISVDFDDAKGRVYFRHDMEITSFSGIDKYQYDEDSVMTLTLPYMVYPLPFKKYDLVQFKYSDEKIQHGILYGIPTQEDFEKRQHTLDISDVNATVHFLFEDEEKNDGNLYRGHEHCYPYELDYSTLPEDDEEYELLMDLREEFEEDDREYEKQKGGEV